MIRSVKTKKVPLYMPTLVKSLISAVCLMLTAVAITGCDAPKARQAWNEQADSFVSEYLRLHPEVGVKEGFHNFDGQVTDHSKQGVADRLAFFDSMQSHLIHFDLTSLNSEQRFEYRFIMQVIDSHIWELRNAETWRYNFVKYEPSLDPSAYVEHDYADKATRFAALERHIQTMPATLKNIRVQMQAPLGKTYRKIALQQLKGLKSYLSYKTARVFRAEIAASSTYKTHLDNAISEIITTFEWIAAMPSDTSDHRLGALGIKSMLLAKEGLTLNVDTLREKGQISLNENLAKLEQVCEQYASGLSIAHCIKRTKASKPYPNAVAALRRDIPKLRKFIEDADIVAVPPMANVEVKQMPSHLRRFQSFLETSGSGSSELAAVFYVALPDPSWPEKRQFDYIPSRSDMIIGTAHEVWPGHYLHERIAATSTSDIAKIFKSYALLEGWATYAEELILDYGYENNDPELRISQLSKAIVRDLRLLASIDLHTNDASIESIAKIFHKQGFLSPEFALKEAERGIYDPEYINYTLGRIFIKQLRDEWSTPLGGQRAWSDFHEMLLQFGSPPLGLVEQLLFRWDAAPR